VGLPVGALRLRVKHNCGRGRTKQVGATFGWSGKQVWKYDRLLQGRQQGGGGAPRRRGQDAARRGRREGGAAKTE